tara:strand:+ start:23862 stop:24932 length:1071 start_codon:yes stop_codon:yes gene_type:complete
MNNFNKNTIKESKNIAIALFIVFPEDKKYKEKNLLSQIELSGIYLSYFQNKIQTLILSNNINLLKKCSFYRRYKKNNIKLFNLEDYNLTLCKNEKNQKFQYAFPKIDCLPIINDYFKKQANFSHLIISDIDSIFLDINYLIEYVKNVKTISAIDYYPDNYLKKDFQKMMKKLISSSFQDSFYLEDKKIKTKKMCWINSGFMIINKELLNHLPELSKSCYEWASENKNYIRESMGWGTEVIFSAIFNFVNGKKIAIRHSKVARFIWTCNIALYLPYEIINPLNIPSHIHLPAIKWVEKQLQILTLLGRYKKLRFLSIFFINMWGLTERIENSSRSKIHFRVILKLLSLTEEFIIRIL